MTALGKGTVVVIGMLLHLFAFVTLWRWFVVPFGLPQVNVWHAWGLLLLASLFATTWHIKRETDDFARVASLEIGVPLVALLFGWIAHFGVAL